MFCKRGIFVNWGNIPPQEIEFGPINLFSGGNGSGKTTCADGLQALMTAAHENLFNFNPGQDETTQRGRGGKQVRTLASYVLGCDDGSYARPSAADGYIAGIFHPTQGEQGERFTAIMCMRASLDAASSIRQARLDELQFIIIPNEELSISDFVREDKGGKYVVPIGELGKLLKQKFGANGIEIYDKKGPYLRRLYGIFKNEKAGITDREAKHAARTFSNFMAYKPVKSISDFVAREILEPKDLSDDIRQVSELMKTIHAMEEDTRHVNDAIENLDGARTAANQYIDQWTARSLAQYRESARLVAAKQSDYVKQRQEQATLNDEIKKCETDINVCKNKRESLNNEQVELLAQRQGITALKDKDQLESEVAHLQGELSKRAGPLLLQDKQFGHNFSAAQLIAKQLHENSFELLAPSLGQKTFRSALKALIDAGPDSGIDMQNLLTKDWVDSSELQQKLESVLGFEACHNRVAQMLSDDIPEQLSSALHRSRENFQKSKTLLAAKQHEVQKLQHQRVSYPASVEQALKAIEEKCPAAQPRVLCDFIEVDDADWQMAIEGYLGGARFGIVVEPEHEAEAAQIVRSMGGRRNNARVIQGSKAAREAKRINIPANSILETMSFDHKIVEYYMQLSYGNVVRVASAEALRHCARGICAEGLGSGNYSMFRCDLDESELVFGRAARARALSAKQSQLDKLFIQLNTEEQQVQALESLLRAIRDLRQVHCADAIQELLDIFRKLQACETKLNALDIGEHSDFEERLDELRLALKEVDKQLRQLGENLGALKNKLETLERSLKRIADEQEVLQQAQETAEAEVQKICQFNADFNAESALADADQSARDNHQHSLADELEDYARNLDRNERWLYDAILEHNRLGQSYQSIQYELGQEDRHSLSFFAKINQLQQEIDRIHNALKNNVLVGRHQKLLSLKDSFNTTFVTSLCHSIYQSINDGKLTLDELNRELEHHRFGADKERFYFSYSWLPEFKEYWTFFEELIKTPSLGDGSTLFDLELSEQSSQVRDKLLSMLLDNDEQRALNELRRISDYRNYRRYEIFKQPDNKEPIPLSTYGTGSGGQLETPAYIIRSAAITSAFRFNEGKSHCRMVLVDEAFSKMDETRSREVIHYLTETLGLQLIFIMPSSKSGPFMDLISHQVVFSKCPSSNPVGELSTRVLVDRKVCNQERIAELWANHRRTIRHQENLDFMEEIGA
jgi:energy-coupling factor transporter ATP-binding protein EcfA2